MTEKILSVKDVMDITGKSSLTIRNWINKGKLPGAVKSPSGKEWMIPESALQGFTSTSPSSTEEPKPTQASQSESTEVKRAKEAAEIAISSNKQSEQEILKKLREQGYGSLEQALADIAKEKEDANLIFEEAQKAAMAITEDREKFEGEKEKLLNAYSIVKEREGAVGARLEQAIVIEKGVKENQSRYKVLIEELNSLINYHGEHIKPCVRALRVIRKSIYAWIEPLNETKYDFSILYNHIGRVMEAIEKYLDNVPKTISTDMIPEMLEDENTNNNKVRE